MSCWVCKADAVRIDGHGLGWCQEHIDTIWKEALGDNPED